MKIIRSTCWMCSKLKLNTKWHHSGVFIVDFDQSQYISIVLLLLTLNKHLSVRCEIQIIMFWKHKKRYICFVIKVARPISFSNLSLHQIEINYEQMTILWTYSSSIGSFFMVVDGGGWEKISVTMVGRRQKQQQHTHTLAKIP